MREFCVWAAKILLLVLAGVGGAVLVSVLVCPRLYDLVELRCDWWHEYAVRLFIMTALGLFLAGWLSFIVGHLTVDRLRIWAVVAAAGAGILAVCILDRRNDLLSEPSWIRYPTVGFLLLTSVLSGLIARWYQTRGGTARRLHWLWWAVAGGGLLLALDELLMLHERFGAFVEGKLDLPHVFTDLITLGYALLALLFVVLVGPRLYREYLPRHRVFVLLVVSGIVTFGLSQVLDSGDVVLHGWLLDRAVRLSDEGHLFSDLWYVIWSPHRLLNSIEEILENMAAALFFAGTLQLVLEKYRIGARGDTVVMARPRLAGALLFGLVATGVVGVAWAAPRYRIDSAAVDAEATAVVTAGDGLFHTDVVFHHPRWGLLIANEGRGDVLVYRAGRLDALPDPQHVLTDVDCVTATDRAVYISSPHQSTIFEYTEEGGLVPFLDETGGIERPEGLVVVGTTMYVVDETSNAIHAIDMKSRFVTTEPIRDERYFWPEGIAYHAGLDELLVTDDVSGYVMALRFGESARVFASPDQGMLFPEDITVTSDGHVFVSDSGRRQVVEFDAEGRVLGRTVFHRMYADLVGVAVDEDEGRVLYITSSDGYGSTSFMPSTVWRVDLGR